MSLKDKVRLISIPIMVLMHGGLYYILLTYVAMSIHFFIGIIYGTILTAIILTIYEEIDKIEKGESDEDEN